MIQCNLQIYFSTSTYMKCNTGTQFVYERNNSFLKTLYVVLYTESKKFVYMKFFVLPWQPLK